MRGVGVWGSEVRKRRKIKMGGLILRKMVVLGVVESEE